MNPQLKTNLANLPSNYSTWAAVALAVLGYITSTGAQSFDDLVNNFSPQKLVMFLVALAAFVAARVTPQPAREQPAPQPFDQQDTEPMGPS